MVTLILWGALGSGLWDIVVGLHSGLERMVVGLHSGLEGMVVGLHSGLVKWMRAVGPG